MTHFAKGASHRKDLDPYYFIGRTLAPPAHPCHHCMHTPHMNLPSRNPPTPHPMLLPHAPTMHDAEGGTHPIRTLHTPHTNHTFLRERAQEMGDTREREREGGREVVCLRASGGEPSAPSQQPTHIYIYHARISTNSNCAYTTHANRLRPTHT